LFLGLVCGKTEQDHRYLGRDARVIVVDADALEGLYTTVGAVWDPPGIVVCDARSKVAHNRHEKEANRLRQ